MATIQDFRDRFPQYADPTAYPTGRLDVLLLEATASVNICIFGARSDTAVLLKMAHFLEMTSGARSQGAQSVSAGQASVSFSAAAPGDLTSYRLTGPGLLYLDLLRSLGITPALVWDLGCGC